MRPAKQLVFDLFAGNRSVRIDVLPNGNIRLVSGRDWRVTQKIAGLGKIKNYGASWLSLDGISFAASGTKPIAFKW